MALTTILSAFLHLWHGFLRRFILQCISLAKYYVLMTICKNQIQLDCFAKLKMSNIMLFTAAQIMAKQKLLKSFRSIRGVYALSVRQNTKYFYKRVHIIQSRK